ERLLGHAVTAEVERDDPEVVGEGTGGLPRPAQLGLRPAVDEHDRRPLRVAPLPNVQSERAAPAQVARRGRLAVHRRIDAERALHLRASFRSVSGPAFVLRATKLRAVAGPGIGVSTQ